MLAKGKGALSKLVNKAEGVGGETQEDQGSTPRVEVEPCCFDALPATTLQELIKRNPGGESVGGAPSTEAVWGEIVAGEVGSLAKEPERGSETSS